MSQVIELAEKAPTNVVKFPQVLHTFGGDRVFVVFTTLADTMAAVDVADGLARSRGVPVTVVHFRTVSHALPVDRPDGISPLESEDFHGELCAHGRFVDARIILCRDERTAIAQAFTPHSLIVVGGRRRWWPTRAEKWCRMLEDAGHYVVFVDKEHSHA